jgi:peptide/nickel transport system permease protein
MIAYVTRRVAAAAGVIYVVVSLSFFMIRLMPGNAMEFLTQQLELQGNLTPQEIQEKIQAIWGVLPTSPLWQQYFTYVGHAFQGNLGTSLLDPGETVIHIVAGAAPWTIFAVGSALLISFILGVIIGTGMAVFQHTRWSKLATLVVSFFNAIPLYVAAIILIYFLSDRLQILPGSGAYGLGVTAGFNWSFIASVLQHAVLPIASYVITSIGYWALTMKGAAISTLGSEYVRAAESRGLDRRRVSQSYVGRNSMLPMVTSFGLNVGLLFGGSVFIETYFIYPGIGYYLIESVDARDYSLMMGCFILITVAVVIANLLVDLLYPLVDPRIARVDISRRAKAALRIEAAEPVLPVGSTMS